MVPQIYNMDSQNEEKQEEIQTPSAAYLQKPLERE